MLAESNRTSSPSALPSVQPPPSQPPAAQPMQSTTPSTNGFWQAVQRRKWTILGVTLAVTSGFWAWTLARPPMYDGGFQIATLPTPVFDPFAEQPEDDAAVQPETGAEIEIETLRSAVLLAVEDLQRSYPALDYVTLSENLTIESATEGGVVSVRYRDTDLEQIETVLAAIAESYEPYALEQNQIVATPTVSETPIAPNRPAGLGLGLMAGLLAGSVAAAIAEKRDRTFHSPSELKPFTQLPTLGIIPFSATLQATRSATVLSQPVPNEAPDYQATSFLEAFRSLYANLRFATHQRSLRSLVISSAVPAEGKSTTALNLARAAAVMGQRVLLVDADLRLPQLHMRLNLPDTIGLSDVLAADLNWRDLLHQSVLDENLLVLAAGTVPPDPVKLLSSAKMQQVISETAAEFDLVIYDVPPLLGFTDSSLLTAQTDGMILVVGLGTTDRVELRQALDSLEVAPAQVLGMVANGIKEYTTQAYGYDRYHRYYAQNAQRLGKSAPVPIAPQTPQVTPIAPPNVQEISLTHSALLDADESDPVEFNVDSNSAASPEDESALTSENLQLSAAQNPIEAPTLIQPEDPTPRVVEIEIEPLSAEEPTTAITSLLAVPKHPNVFQQIWGEMGAIAHIWTAAPELLRQLKDKSPETQGSEETPSEAIDLASALPAEGELQAASDLSDVEQCVEAEPSPEAIAQLTLIPDPTDEVAIASEPIEGGAACDLLNDAANPELSPEELATLEEHGFLVSLDLPDENSVRDHLADPEPDAASVPESYAPDVEADRVTDDPIPDPATPDPTTASEDLTEAIDSSAPAQDTPEEDSFAHAKIFIPPASTNNVAALTDRDRLAILNAEDFGIETEEEFLTGDILEFEETELEELLAWDTANSSAVDPSSDHSFEAGILSAQSAIQAGDQASTPDDWLALSTQWLQASELMGKVSPDDENYEIAQRCQSLYRSNSEFAYQKAKEVDRDA